MIIPLPSSFIFDLLFNPGHWIRFMNLTNFIYLIIQLMGLNDYLIIPV